MPKLFYIGVIWPQKSNLFPLYRQFCHIFGKFNCNWVYKTKASRSYLVPIIHGCSRNRIWKREHFGLIEEIAEKTGPNLVINDRGGPIEVLKRSWRNKEIKPRWPHSNIWLDWYFSRNRPNSQEIQYLSSITKKTWFLLGWRKPNVSALADVSIGNWTISFRDRWWWASKPKSRSIFRCWT